MKRKRYKSAYQRALAVFKDDLGVDHKLAQTLFKQYKEAYPNRKHSATALRRVGANRLAKDAVAASNAIARGERQRKRKPLPKERTVFEAPEKHGELWSAVDRASGGEIDLRLMSIRGINLLVRVTIHKFKNDTKTWTTHVKEFTTTHDDFWTDFHNSLREDFERDSDAAYNVGSISVAPV